MTTRYQRAKRIDQLATWGITVGGVAVIVCVIAILVLIAKEALPLFAGTKHEVIASRSAADKQAIGVGVGDRLENAYVLTGDGAVHVFALPGGEDIETVQIQPPSGAKQLAGVHSTGDNDYTMWWDNGIVTLDEVEFKPTFDAEGTRSIRPTLKRRAEMDGGPTINTARLRVAEEGQVTLVALRDDGSLLVRQQTREEDFLGNETVEDFEVEIPARPGELITALAVDVAGFRLFIGNAGGAVRGWDLRRAGKAEPIAEVTAANPGDRITALAFVFGGESLAVADVGKGLGVWSLVPVVSGQKGREFKKIHDLASPDAPIRTLFASRRDKSIVSVNEVGGIALDHTTSESRLLELSPEPGLTHVAMSRRGNGFVGIAEDGQVTVWGLENPHPETSATVLFGKVWYEGYREPEYVWQSSSASDDFEPKMSIVPLVFGSVKGTAYAMIFALPLALFGALYTSQLTRPEIRDVIKPVVEIMAAIPSVIIGFLAALWLAPLFERNLGALFLSLALIPSSILVAVLAWNGLRRIKALQFIEGGFEFIAIVPAVILGMMLAGWLGPWMERTMFEGDLQQWMYQEAGIRYDPRNCIVIAFALGFAVIPIIFTIAEDAFSNVPRSLTAGSLALGASRWQTVWRVVLPSASPGIFAGAVIGLGRAVGETMIVLMATGNTPIMDWSVFNGMRTLSANIAVEVPEAPHGGTLYRVLFLSAVVLFLMTFVLNTVAELVRQRLRKKYAQFQ